MAKPGDTVRITAKDGVYEGILMPRPEILEKNIIVVKLENGYNIGIKQEHIIKTEQLNEYKPKAATAHPIGHAKNLPLIPILSFGGTIASRVDYKTGGVSADYTAEDFVQMMPELKSVANLKARKVMGVMSEDMLPEDWKTMAKAITEELNSEAKGVVVSQGTDTLHFSTAAMSFMIKNINKPVVFTASQRSIDRGSSDAFMNLQCAIHAAAKFPAAEVMTCMHASSDDKGCLLIRGTKVRKMHTSRRDAFRPINEMPLALISEEGKIEQKNMNIKKPHDGKAEVDAKFEEKTALITVYPGMEPKVLDFYVKEGYKGIVLAATALGHVPTNNKKNILDNIKSATDSGVAIVIASQTIYGRVHPLVYTNLRKLSIGLDCIFAEDMLPEVAYVKLGWVGGHTHDMKKIREMMLTNYAGEINTRTDEESFLY